MSKKISPPLARLSVAVATCGYIGLLPRYPRAILAAGLAWPFVRFASPLLPVDVAPRAVIVGLFVLALCLLGYLAARRAVPLPPYDREQIVIDEFIGGVIASLPSLFFTFADWHVPVAITVFLVCDLFKPFGIARIDAWEHHAAVILDDVAAGLVAMSSCFAFALLV